MELRRIYRKFITGDHSQVTKPFQPSGFEVNKLSTYTKPFKIS